MFIGSGTEYFYWWISLCHFLAKHFYGRSGIRFSGGFVSEWPSITAIVSIGTPSLYHPEALVRRNKSKLLGFFRHSRSMHLYMAGMPLELITQWLGHSQLDTTLIYARATTEMKREAIEKISQKEDSVFRDKEKFKYANDDEIIKRLYGLK